MEAPLPSGCTSHSLLITAAAFRSNIRLTSIWMFSSFCTRLSPWDLFIIPTAHYWWQHIPPCLFSEKQTHARVSLLALNASTVLQITGHKLSLVSVCQCQVCLRICLPVFCPAIASPQHCPPHATRIHCFASKLSCNLMLATHHLSTTIASVLLSLVRVCCRRFPIFSSTCLVIFPSRALASQRWS